MTNKNQNIETRSIVIYGFTRQDLEGVLKHFKEALPDCITLTSRTEAECTTITLAGRGEGIELLRFNLNKFHRILANLFKEELLDTEDRTISCILGRKLLENNLTVASAESCTGGNIAHKIVQTSGSSAYFLGSIVSYSNEVKASLLGVDRTIIDRYGAVSRNVVEAMVNGVCNIMRTDCGIATSGIAGPHGGTPAKPVGTVWFAVKYRDKVVSEMRMFKGDRNSVIESATNHAMVMLLRLLRNEYIAPDEYAGDE